MMIGGSEEYTYATAKVSFAIAESQIFRPERVRIEKIFNDMIFPAMGIKFWKLRLLGPELADDDSILKALVVADKVGALTPNAAIGVVNKLFRMQMQPIKEAWGNLPFAICVKLAGNSNGEGVGLIIPAIDGENLPSESDLRGDLTEDTKKAGMLALGRLRTFVEAVDEL
jgi:capsid portal protein